jgi:hypothetical protein
LRHPEPQGVAADVLARRIIDVDDPIRDLLEYQEPDRICGDAGDLARDLRGPPTTAAANATRPNVPIRVTLGKRIHLATNVVGGETRLRSDFGMLSAGCLK